MSNSEVEKRYRVTDYDIIKQKLDSNSKYEKGYLFRVTLFNSNKPKQIIRVRDESKQITFTIKNKEKEFAEEFEVIVSDYLTTIEMLKQLGHEINYSMEKYREIYYNKEYDVEIVLDHFPGLPPYIEIESKKSNEKDVDAFAKILELKDDGQFGAKDLYYEHYGITKDRKESNTTFETIYDIFEPYITKNKKDFLRIITKQIISFNLS